MAASHVLDSDSSGGEWEELEEDGGFFETACLLCSQVLPSPDAVIAHCEREHNLDLKRLKEKYEMDFVQYVKLVNYLRRCKPSPEQFEEVLKSCSAPPWLGDEFLKTTLEDDPMLQFDFDGLEEDLLKEMPKQEQSSSSEARSEECKLALHRALQDMECMRDRVSELLAPPPDADLPPGSEPCTLDSGPSLDGDAYFASYANISIHEDMLKDDIRTQAYKQFIEGNPQLFKGRVVMDVGCGTGILSIFAAKTGAKKVVAVDNSSILYSAMDIVRENGLQEVIELVKDRVEEVKLPDESKVDLIISEWMGYCLLFESMLDSVLVARDRFLKDKTQVYPNKCCLFLTGISDEDLYGNKVQYWDSVYGVKMAVMKRQCLREAYIINIAEKSVSTTPSVVKTIDVGTVNVGDLDFNSSFELDVVTTGSLHGFALYFDVHFIPPGKEGKSVVMSTSPGGKTTHWAQTVVFISQPHPLCHGSRIKGEIKYEKSSTDHRSGRVEISWQHSGDESTATVVRQDWTLAR